MVALYKDLSLLFSGLASINRYGPVNCITSLADLKKRHGFHSSAELIVGFLSYYAQRHPELLEERLKRPDDGQHGPTIYQFKSREAFLKNAKLGKLLREMRGANIDPQQAMEELYEDLDRLFRAMSFYMGKGMSFDSISNYELREEYAGISPPELMVDFFEFYARQHPELIEVRMPRRTELPQDYKDYRLKSDAAFLDSPKLKALIAAMWASRLDDSIPTDGG